MNPYAIVNFSGNQFFIEEGKFYDFDKLPLEIGDHFFFEQILAIKQAGLLRIGDPFLNEYRIQATVIRHLSGQKIRIYKMRAKKKTRKTFGSRRKLTRVLIKSIYKIRSF